MTPGNMLTRRKKMGLSKQLRTSFLLIIWITFFGNVQSQQDTANYYFPQPAQSRFVSSFSSRNGFVPGNAYSPLGIRSNLAATAPASYHEQTLYIDPLEADQNAQYPIVSTRNPDYSELSPRPFSPSGSRPRPGSNAGSGTAAGHQFVPHKAANGGGNRVSNVPYQQNQFLAHFNDQERTHQQPPRVSRPTNGFTPNRQASGFTRPNNNDLYPTHQQLPFRNSRNRFQPSSTEHQSPPSSSEKPQLSVRFGSNNQQQTRPVAAPVLKAKPNKSLYQPRKPSLGSRESNSPFRSQIAPIIPKVKNGNGSNINKDVTQEINEDEPNNPNMLKSQPNASSEESEEALSQEQASKENNGKEAEIISPNEKAIILTSNFFLPPPSGDQAHSQRLEEKPNSSTENPSDYGSEEYEDYDDDYEDEPTTVLPEIQSEIASTSPSVSNSLGSTSAEKEEETTTQEDLLEDTTIAQEINQGLVADTEEYGSGQTESLNEDPEESTTLTEEIPHQTDTPTELSLEDESKFTSADAIQNQKNESRTEADFNFKIDGFKEHFSTDDGSILGEAVVSVVTSKSVINGSTSFAAPVTQSSVPSEFLLHDAFDQEKSSSTENAGVASPENKITEKQETSMETSEEQPPKSEIEESNNATESWVVVASIQTSRSISGARFLPFPAIEQEEKKQPLSELERKIHEQKSSRPPKKSEEIPDQPKDSIESATAQASSTDETSERSVVGSVSTESIIDKLDRVQSELSSGLLSGKFPILNEMPNLMRPTTQSTTTSSHQPVVIKKFSPKTTTNKTPDVKKPIFEELPSDDLTGLLPPGFKARPPSSYRNKKVTTTTKSPDFKAQRNATTGRSIKNSPVFAQEVILAGLIPKGYTLNDTSTTEAPSGPLTALEDLFSKIKFEDNISALLPKDYKSPASTTTTQKPTATTKKQVATTLDDINKFLPPGYKLRTTTTTKSPKLGAIPIKDDLSHLLPPGFKSTEEKPTKPIVSVNDDISKFLPPGFKLDSSQDDSNIDILKLLPKDNEPKTEQEVQTSTASTTTLTTSEAPVFTSSTKPDVPLKVVFPKSLNKRPGQRLTTAKPLTGDGPAPPPISIKKGPPTRATTEFTGWPTPSTTPLSIEKLLERQKAAAINVADLLPSSTSTTTSTTTTTTTTTEAPRPTEPGLCHSECDLAGTIKIVDGVQWKPELLDHNTIEWKTLARELETQLNEVYINAPYLSRWYKKVRIDSFSKGSVLVDYFVELANVTRDVNTLEIKQLFHDALTVAPLPVAPLPSNHSNDNSEDNETAKGSDRQGRDEKLVKETFLLGRFAVEPEATDFIVIPKPLGPNIQNPDDENLLPHWAIVLIVIGVGSLLFIIVFGVLVLINRQNRAKKTPTPLTSDMLNELNKNHMGGMESYGTDEFYNVDDTWGDNKPPPIKPKRFTNSMHGSSGSNIYDSWRSQRYGDFYYDNHSYTPHKGDGYPPDEFEDSHQMYTYNNRPRYNRDYDPDF